MENQNNLLESELEMIQKGKKVWDLDVLNKMDGGRVKSSTIKDLIGRVIENTWGEAKKFYTKNNSIDESNLDEVTKNQFYHESMWTYYRLFFYSPLPDSKKIYGQLYNDYMNKLLARLDKNSTFYLSIIERVYREKNDIIKVKH